MKVPANPAGARIAALLRKHDELFGAWSGPIYRVSSLDYPSAAAILSGEGSYRHGGRWNAMQSHHAVYGSTSDVVAVAESRATVTYAGMRPPLRAPQLLVTIELRLQRIVDLTQAATREMLEIDLAAADQEDWRKLQDAGRESFTQACGRAVFSRGGEGLVVPSARVPDGINVVVFPKTLHRLSRVTVFQSDKLERLRSDA